MKMGTIRSPWRYDALLESTPSATIARLDGRGFYAGRPVRQSGTARLVPDRNSHP
jgi:hypothetical protein